MRKEMPMSDNEFSTLIPETLDFMADLAMNNTREWFSTHKSEYEALVKQPAERLLETVGATLQAQTGVPVTPKLYRIHRDLRFSKDKTPYNTHLHLQWNPPGPVGFLFGVSANYVCAGAGVMGFASPELARWRERIGGKAGDALVRRVALLVKEGHRIDAPELKRVPPPDGPHHPRADYLRRKSLILWHDFTAAERDAPAAALARIFANFTPFAGDLATLLGPD
jgi:uncharacterized protein (TIGR02453 family)